MKALSDQLFALSGRAKKTEDVIAAARAKNRAELEAQKAELQSAADKANASVAQAQGDVTGWWNETRANADARFALLRAKADQRRADLDAKRAEHRAEEAEQDASDAVDYAILVLEQADYAVVDAALARAEADAAAADAS